MKQYLDLMHNVLENGTWQANRTGVYSKMLPGAMLQFDLRKGFPAVTTKKLAYKAVVGELKGFLNGCDTVREFNEFGCRVWDANGSAPSWTNNQHYKDVVYQRGLGTSYYEDVGYLGRIYGVQWRDWSGSNGESYDQIAALIEQIRTNPTSRRLVVSAWRPDEMDQMALPPCHYAFQVIIEQETKTMHLLWNQRSCDLFLGVPFNIASYATLLHILARITGYNVGTLTGFLADVHIYENHVDQCMEQLSRTPKPLPELIICSTVKEGSSLESIRADDILLNKYDPWPAIKAEMAV